MCWWSRTSPGWSKIGPGYYFLPPQIWAWAGFRKYFIKKWVDQVISVFPFEYRFYKKVGIETFYFKNPLLSHLKSYRRRDFRCRIGLMPGSRFDQIKRNLVVMRKLIKEFYKFKNNIEFCLILYDRVDSLKVQIPAQIKVITQNRYQAMKDCDLLIISSGTASLEARIMSIPQIFVHRPAVFDYYFFRRFIRIKEYNLANLYFNNRDVPAYISPDSNYLSEKLFNHIQDILPSLGLKW
ncbi:hypothetical protein BXT86_04850 [candidate division WOR-3 bacterium 4484_100]|uniref:Lipid-A-disaccharide synthase n=1 Tax=candidate division WOR-3 bacterium 4484_100 TaxID=1936077 RepID=A0A1V4QEU3_UNCW3|nr:MAG: hypothetical protein BXT86_04850 [candidate division WOR-3 bacterium 4484_100]